MSHVYRDKKKKKIKGAIKYRSYLIVNPLCYDEIIYVTSKHIAFSLRLGNKIHLEV